MPSTSSRLVPAGAAARVDVAALRRNIFARRLPWSEKYRNVYGGDLDIDRIANALLAARVGIMVDLSDIAREQFVMDPHLNMLGQKRMGRLALADYKLSPRVSGLSRQEKAMSKQLTEMVRGKLERCRNLKQAIYDLAWGHFDARACLEIDWQWSSGRAPYTPASLDWIHPRRLGFGPNRELRLIETFLRVGWFEPVGVDFSDIPGKFITYLPRRWADYPELEGLAPRSIYYSFFKRYGTRKRNQLTELFVLPWRTLEADKDAPVQADDMDNAVEIAENMGDETVAGFPRGIHMNMLWPGTENQGQIMGATIEDVDSQMSRLWELTDAGSKSTPDAGGGQGGDQAAYQEMQHQIAFALDGIGISERIQVGLIDPIVLLNAGPDLVYLSPIFEIITAPPKDRKAEQERYSKAIMDHVPVALADYYEATGIRVPEDDEAVLVMAPGANGAPGEIRIVVPEGARPPAGMLPPGLAPAGAASSAPGASPAEPSGELFQPNTKLKGNDATPEDEDEPGEPGEPTEQGDAGAALRGILGLERGGIELARQPDRGHGSPEVLIERGLREGARHTTGWAALMSSAVEGLTSASAIHRALERSAAELPLEGFAASVERSLVRGVMIGALDSAWEAEADQPVEIPAFTREEAPRLFAGSPTPGFAATPFQQAISFFLSKKVIAKREFDRLRAAAKAEAFTVATLAKDAMLKTARDALATTMQTGTDLRAFAKDLGERFDSAGWTRLKPSHVELVFRNNVMGAIATGRDRQMSQPAVLAARPYWQILGVDDGRTRPAHRAAHGKVLRADDPFWKASRLPFGHNCRCRKISRSAKDLERLKLEVTSGASISGLPDKGWSHASL